MRVFSLQDAPYSTSPHVRLAFSRLLSGFIAWGLLAVFVGALGHLACLVIAMLDGLRMVQISGIVAHGLLLAHQNAVDMQNGQQDPDQPRIVKYGCNEFAEPRLP